MPKRSYSAVCLVAVAMAAACGGTVTDRTGNGASENGGTGGFGSGGMNPGSGGLPYFGGGPSSGGFPVGSGAFPNGYGGAVPIGGAPTGSGGDVGEPTCFGPVPDPGGTRQHGDYCGDLPAGPEGVCLTVSEAAIDPLAGLLGPAECASPLVCVPQASAYGGSADGGLPGAPHTACQTTLGLGEPRDGGCVMTPFTQRFPFRKLLTRENCGEVETCVPCTDPVTGASTGACTNLIGGCQGPCPSPQGRVLPPCGVFDGGPSVARCVATSVANQLPQDGWIFYKQDECEPGDVCVPTRFLENPSACRPSCRTALGPFGDQYLPGACIATYQMRDVNPPALAVLTQGSCAGGELCAPCLDPLNAGAPTHACD